MRTRSQGCCLGGPCRAVRLLSGWGTPTSQGTQGRGSPACPCSPGWAPCIRGSRSCRSPLAPAARPPRPPRSQLPSSDLHGKGRGRWPWSPPSSALHPGTAGWVVDCRESEMLLADINLSAPCHALHPACCQCQLPFRLGEPVPEQAVTPWLTLVLCPPNPGRPPPISARHPPGPCSYPTPALTQVPHLFFPYV